MHKKVLVIIDFSEKVGNGHKNRVNSILKKLNIEQLDVQKILLDYTNKEIVINNLKETHFRKESYQLLLIDSFILSDKEIIFLSNFFKNVLVIDDWIGRKLIGNNIYILDWTAMAERSPIHLSQKNLKKFLGLEYCPIERKHSYKKTNDFLIHLGSNIKTSIYVDIIKYISRKYSDKKITVIDKKIIKIKEMIPSSKNCEFLDYLNENEFKNYLLSSRFFISTGGWSCYQAISLNCFPLLISLNDSNTYFDCYGIVFGGYGKAFGFINEFDKLNIISKDLDFQNNYLTANKIGEKFLLLNKLLDK